MPGDGEAGDTASAVEMDLGICHFVYLESPAGYPESPRFGICDTAELIRWKDKNDVLMISTRPSHLSGVVDSGKTNYQNERIMKPQVVLDYNQGRQSTDLSDQLSTYYTCLRNPSNGTARWHSNWFSGRHW